VPPFFLSGMRKKWEERPACSTFPERCREPVDFRCGVFLGMYEGEMSEMGSHFTD
jgi:hypothetical protein